jgi:hypothetical protein
MGLGHEMARIEVMRDVEVERPLIIGPSEWVTNRSKMSLARLLLTICAI